MDQEDGISRWRQVGDALIHEISQGLVAPGEKLPAEVDLASRFGVARQTIRRAILHLQGEGLLRSEHGRGTFVTEGVLRYRLSARKYFEQSILETQRTPSRRLISKVALPATAAVAHELSLPEGEAVLLMITQGLADDAPVTVAHNYFALSRLPGIADHFSPERLSVSQALAEAGIAESRRQSMRLKARPATEEESRLLAIARSEYVMETISIIADTNETPLLYSITSYASSKVEFVIDKELFRKLAG